jgi:hypothetical protein
MREQPWHLRRATTHHHLWYRNLIELHGLTTSWLREADLQPSAHALSRGITQSPEIAETLWMLDSIAEEAGRTRDGLESLLDDTSPEDVLGRLERTVWAVHALTAFNILDRAKSEDRAAVMNQLEQTAWRAGRECALVRWPHLPEEVRQDLRGVLAAYRNSPFGGSQSREPLLVRRSVARELSLELLSCPHRSPYIEVQSVSDALCLLHAHFARGYAYSLNTRISIEHANGGEGRRCQQRWHFL